MEAGSAEGGAQGGAVDGDHSLQAAGTVLAENDLLMATLLRSEQSVQNAAVGAGWRPDVRQSLW